MKARIGLALEAVGGAIIAYALYSIAPWAGIVAAGAVCIIIGAYLGAAK